MKMFISSDIEGTTGIAHWDETEATHPKYAYFARQMALEVAAVCEGAIAAGCDEILVKDAHDTGRNIDPSMLPSTVRVFRGWDSHPFCMVAGLDHSFDAIAFTGYHSPAGADGNPLAHTMNGQNECVKINGELASELMLGCLTSAMVNVPVRCVTGDAALCEWIEKKIPGVMTVPVNEGIGYASIGMHPENAIFAIREAAARCFLAPKEQCMYPMPDDFTIEITYRKHQSARRAGFFPGAKQTGAKTVEFFTKDWMEALIFLSFVL